MPLVVKNTRDLAKPENLHLKMLLVAMPGFGKTKFLSTVPEIGVGACETGVGDGLASVIKQEVDYVELTNYQDFDLFCSGGVFKEKAAIGLDSLSAMTKTFIKDYALSFPNAGGDTPRRRAGVPELRDFGTMGEITRRLVTKLLVQPRHTIVTTTLRIDKPDPETGQGEFMIGPDLPGQLFLGSTAMFDLVLVGRTRQLLRDPKDAKSKYLQRYWVTEGGGGIIAKCRFNQDTKRNILAPEELYDIEAGVGTFPYLLDKIKRGLAEPLTP